MLAAAARRHGNDRQIPGGRSPLSNPKSFAGITDREAILIFLEDPRSSNKAKLFSIGLTILIILSVIAFTMETMPEFHNYGLFWFSVEAFFTIVFTIEYILRLSVSFRSRKYPGFKFFRDWYNFFDLAAIFPFYLELILAGSQGGSGACGVCQYMRFLRALRLLKLGRMGGRNILFKAFFASVRHLTMPLFFLFVVCIFFATWIYYLERGEPNSSGVRVMPNGDVSQFTSIPKSIWFVLVTMTTVGYGDISPVTLVGKAVATLAICTGLIFISVPLAVMGDSFLALEKQKEVEKAREAAGVGPPVSLSRHLDLYMEYTSLARRVAALQHALWTASVRAAERGEVRICPRAPSTDAAGGAAAPHLLWSHSQQQQPAKQHDDPSGGCGGGGGGDVGEVYQLLPREVLTATLEQLQRLTLHSHTITSMVMEGVWTSVNDAADALPQSEREADSENDDDPTIPPHRRHSSAANPAFSPRPTLLSPAANWPADATPLERRRHMQETAAVLWAQSQGMACNDEVAPGPLSLASQLLSPSTPFSGPLPAESDDGGGEGEAREDAATPSSAPAAAAGVHLVVDDSGSSDGMEMVEDLGGDTPLAPRQPSRAAVAPATAAATATNADRSAESKQSAATAAAAVAAEPFQLASPPRRPAADSFFTSPQPPLGHSSSGVWKSHNGVADLAAANHATGGGGGGSGASPMAKARAKRRYPITSLARLSLTAEQRQHAPHCLHAHNSLLVRDDLGDERLLDAIKR